MLLRGLGSDRCVGKNFTKQGLLPFTRELHLQWSTCLSYVRDIPLPGHTPAGPEPGPARLISTLLITVGLSDDNHIGSWFWLLPLNPILTLTCWFPFPAWPQTHHHCDHLSAYTSGWHPWQLWTCFVLPGWVLWDFTCPAARSRPLSDAIFGSQLTLPSRPACPCCLMACFSPQDALT